jgi:WD40 repeat protein
MFRRLLIVPAVAGAALLASTGCNQQPNNVVAGPKNEQGQPQNNGNIGGNLFPPKPVPPATREVTTSAAEPILIPAHTAMTERTEVNLPAMRDSRILFIGTEVKPGEKVPPGRLVYEHRMKTYRQLGAGDYVTEKSTVMLLDDSEAWAKLEAARVAAESSKLILAKAKMVRMETEGLQAKRELSFKQGNFSEIEYIQGKIELARAQATEASQLADLEKAQQEHVSAQINYDYYTVKSSVSGFIQPFNQRPGQSVKALEPVLQIQSVDTLRAEGMVARGYRGRLQRDMPVTIEPMVEEAPSFRRRFHTQAVNGVAVSNTQPRPYIVSVSEDHSARVWDGRSDYEAAIFTHKVSVRSVACSPRGSSKHYCLTGAEDGIARLWDLSTPKSSETPLRAFEGGHKGVISAVAFSPDGRTCATADSRDIVVWDVESGQMKYKLPQYHLGEITSLTFTPQAKLVSAARDLTVRVWSLGQDGARLDYTKEGRSGDVSRIGVSHDGRYFLLDTSEALGLMNVADQRTEGVLEGVNESSKFASFAIFSHDSQLVLTGNQNEGRLSVWRTPTPGNRATQIRQFIPNERLVNFTCGAVSPFDNEPFAVTGAKSGEIYVWRMPTEQELVKMPGVLKFIDQNAAAATGQIKIWAEFPNDKAQLMIGTNVTIVIDPTQAK